MKKKKAVFLDRDGTIIRWVDHINKISNIKIYKRAITALNILIENDFLIFIVTNQASVAKGFMNENQAQQLHQYVVQYLENNKCHITESYLCFHHPNATVKKYKKKCKCRKPNILSAKKAIKKYNISPTDSFMIGDNKSDIDFAKNAGLTSILVETGLGKKYTSKSNPDYTCKNILSSAKLIKKLSRSPSQ